MPKWLNTLFEWLLGERTPDTVPPLPPEGWKPPNIPSLGQLLAEMLPLHNEERHRKGLRFLAHSARLGDAAQAHADWMAANRSVVHYQTPATSHYSATSLLSRVKAAGYPAMYLAENIAAGQRTARQAVEAWMASASHRSNIMDQGIWEVGFGCAPDDFGVLYWCVVFATPRRRAFAFMTDEDVAVSLPAGVVERKI